MSPTPEEAEQESQRGLFDEASSDEKASEGDTQVRNWIVYQRLKKKGKKIMSTTSSVSQCDTLKESSGAKAKQKLTTNLKPYVKKNDKISGC